MSKRNDAILVIDLESTCWEGKPPEGQVSDIIEIGVSVLDLASLERGEKRSLLVRPERSTVSAFCTELTTLRPEDVADAPTLHDACQVLRKEFNSRERPWASFGDYDRVQFERCCEPLGVRYPFGRRHLNVKTLAALAYGWTREKGMAQTLSELGLPLEGTHHRGHDDAHNIAAILAKILTANRASPPGKGTLPGP